MLLDTSGILCYFDKSEARHADATRFFQAAPRRLTHNYVLAEFVPLCQARALSRTSVLAFAEVLLDSPYVEVIWVSESLHRGALSLPQARLDQTYSLCDAVSFLLMRERGITDALMIGRHFEQEGFVRLLKS